MSNLIPLRSHTPELGNGTWLAPGCSVIGQVFTGTQCSIWFSAVVRGDVCAIRMGDRVNVQDGAVLHGTFEKTDLIIGSDVSIGHNATVHGCTLEDGVLIGMGAVVLDGARVGKGAVVAAGAVVLQGSQVGPGELWAGVPAVKVKDVPEAMSAMLVETAKRYVEYAAWYIGTDS